MPLPTIMAVDPKTGELVDVRFKRTCNECGRMFDLWRDPRHASFKIGVVDLEKFARRCPRCRQGEVDTECEAPAQGQRP